MAGKKSRNKKSETPPKANPKINSKIISIIIIGIVGAALAIYLISTQNSQDQARILAQNQTEQDNAEKIIDTCKNVMHCSVTGLDNLTVSEDKDVVLGTFADLVTLYDHRYACHETAHHLGMWLYGYTGDINKSLSYAKMQCGGAVFHGIMQNYFMTKQLHGQSESQIEITKICPVDPENPNSMIRWQCLHGLGHGLMAYYNDNATAAVSHCDELAPGWEQLSCSKGVFMQNMVSHYEVGGGDLNPNDIYYPCDQVDAKYAPACYHYHATYLLEQTNANVSAAFDLCDKITPGTMVKYCYHGMGRQLSTLITSADTIKSGMATCYLGKESEYHADCLNGMLLTVLNGDTDTYWGFKFCSMIEDGYKSDCYDSLGKWIKMLDPTPQEQQAECSKAEDQTYVAICSGASLGNSPLL